MAYSLDQAGVLEVVMERFKNHRLPRVMDIKALVDQGKRLNEYDIAFLEEVFEDTRQYKHFVDEHADFQNLYARLTHLYEEITKKALENEKAGD
jgi:hypothetical protein